MPKALWTALALSSLPLAAAPSTPEARVQHVAAQFLNCAPDSLLLTPQIGYNNTSYTVRCGETLYFAKTGNSDESLIGASIENEAHCMRLVQEAELSPRLLWIDSDHHVLIAEFLCSPFDAEKPGAIERYLHTLRTLHSLDVTFPLAFDPFATFRRYYAAINHAGLLLPKELHSEVLSAVYALENEALFGTCAPCHLDPRWANVLDTDTGVVLVDWEFAAMADPWFDLASMCASQHLTDGEMLTWLDHYLGTTATPAQQDRFMKIRVVADMRMCLFCYLKSSRSKETQQIYSRFAEGFLVRIQERLQRWAAQTDSSGL